MPFLRLFLGRGGNRRGGQELALSSFRKRVGSKVSMIASGECPRRAVPRAMLRNRGISLHQASPARFEPVHSPYPCPQYFGD